MLSTVMGRVPELSSELFQCEVWVKQSLLVSIRYLRRYRIVAVLPLLRLQQRNRKHLYLWKQSFAEQKLF